MMGPVGRQSSRTGSADAAPGGGTPREGRLPAVLADAVSVEAGGASEMDQELIEVGVDRIVLSSDRKPLVVLTDQQQGRLLTIPIGMAEATAIHFELESQKFPRPLTHDLIASVMRGLEVALDRVVVTEIREGTFYAEMSLRVDGQTRSIDARPSDAIAVAIRMGASVYVSSAVMDEASLPAEGLGIRGAEDPDQRQRELRQFRDLLLDLDLHDD